MVGSAIRGVAQSETWVARALYRLCTVYAEAHDHYDYDIETNGERHLLEAVFGGRNGAQPTVAIDCGANRGDWTQIVIELNPRVELHCFEISSSAQDYLKKRFAGNPRVTVNHLGLSDRVGTFEYKDYGVLSGVNTLLMNASFHDSSVPFTIRKTELSIGDSYLTEKRIDTVQFLKIDTEGSEMNVLLGFARALERRAIGVVQFEYGYTHGDAKTLMRDFHELFGSHGYAVGKLTRRGVLFGSFDYRMNDFDSGPNYVAALPEWAARLGRFLPVAASAASSAGARG